MPFHNYAGPGTDVIRRVRAGIRPTTFLDAAALIHDIEYLFYHDQSIPDQTFYLNVSRYSLAVALTAKLAFKVKDLYGYHFKLQPKEYFELKALSAPLLSDYPDMRFTDVVS